jgi:uncharacterized membrane protein
MEWYYEKKGEQFGPISETDLKAMFGRGELTAQNLVWKEGMSDWASYGSVFEQSEVATEVLPRFPRMQRGNTCRELRAQAWEALTGNWLIAALVVFLMQVVMQASGMAAIIPLIGLLVPLFVAGPLTVGMYSYFLRLIRGEQVDVSALFSGFSLWLKYTGLFLFVTFIICCAMLVSAIPGALLVGMVVAKNQAMFDSSPDIAAQDPLFLIGLTVLISLPIVAATYVWIRYALVYFIAVDEPDMPVSDIMRRSAQMMKGQFWKFSLLMLSYTGWFILGFLAFFIGILWSTAYWLAGFAAYYDDLRERSASGLKQ